MADAIVTNEIPATTTSLFALFRLYETLVDAGWVVVDSSLGTADTPDSTDHWAGAFASFASGAWIVLQADSGQQLVFRRSTTSTTLGWIVWLKEGGYVTTGRSATSPGNLPADAAFIRGSGSAPSTYTTGGSWFGASTNTVATLNIGCRDATGQGDESFWVVAQVPGNAYTVATAAGVHRLAFEALEHMAGLGIVDPQPYAWWCPESNTGDWADQLTQLQSLLHPDSVSTGNWRRWWNAGQAGEAFKFYGSGSNYVGSGSAAATTGDDPSFDPALASDSDQVIYQATPVQLLRRIRLTKAIETGFEDPEGGFTTNIFFASDAVASLDTLNDGTYAKFGAWLVVWWDNNPANPPVEN